MKFKELLLREVMVLRTLDRGFLSIPGDLWPVFQCFRPLGLVFEWFFCGTLDPAFDVFGRWLQLFVWGSVFHYPGHAACAVVGSDGRRWPGIWATQIDSVATAKRSTPRRSESNRYRSHPKATSSTTERRSAKPIGGQWLRCGLWLRSSPLAHT